MPGLPRKSSSIIPVLGKLYQDKLFLDKLYEGKLSKEV